MLLPQWCEMKDTDDDKTKSRKKKLLKSYKSKIRFQQMDLEQKKKQQDWHSFVKGKGSKKKVGRGQLSYGWLFQPRILPFEKKLSLVVVVSGVLSF